MIINHNMSAINANRQMASNQSATAKSTEKLSSGLRINRAGDDAAGLAISEKMRAQIAGLDQSTRNAQDGISLIQTAEGALNETHSILQRMRELSVQASNDTNTTEDRTAIEEEINQLTTEIDRISTDTEFNTKKLLDGTFTGSFQIGANSGQTTSVSVGAMSSSALGLSGGTKLNTITAATTGNTALALGEGTYTVDGGDVKDASGQVVGAIDGDGKITLGDTAGTEIDLKHAVTNGSKIEIKANGDADVTLAKSTAGNVDKLAAGEYKVSGDNLLLGDKLVGTLDGTTRTQLTLTDGTVVDLTQAGLNEDDIDTTGAFTIKGIDVSTSDKASGSLDTIDAAIKSVSDQRSKLGAVQNRLEHTINNLGTSSENLTAAESRIRDVDMAKEMMEFTKNNVLSQASQAMLAQAKALPNQVLSLLQ